MKNTDGENWPWKALAGIHGVHIIHGNLVDDGSLKGLAITKA
jgi:hypothetical protein